MLLDLPRGPLRDPPAIGDVNFDTDPQGRLTGRLLGKRVMSGTARPPSRGRSRHPIPFFGPFTMVNGVVWPHQEVEARSYRFRVVNVSLARAYRLAVVDEQSGGRVVPGAMGLIGEGAGAAR